MNSRHLPIGWNIICSICGKVFPLTYEPFENETLPQNWVRVLYPKGLYDSTPDFCSYACCISHGWKLEQIFQELITKKLLSNNIS